MMNPFALVVTLLTFTLWVSCHSPDSTKQEEEKPIPECESTAILQFKLYNLSTETNSEDFFEFLNQKFPEALKLANQQIDLPINTEEIHFKFDQAENSLIYVTLESFKPCDCVHLLNLTLDELVNLSNEQQIAHSQKELNLINQEMDSIMKTLNQLDNKTASTPSNDSAFIYKTEIAVQEKYYTYLLEKKAEWSIMQAGITSPFKIIEKAK